MSLVVPTSVNKCSPVGSCCPGFLFCLQDIVSDGIKDVLLINSQPNLCFEV